MAPCPPHLLEDLADVFAELRAWAGMTEQRRGVFYVRGAPFLHFHVMKDGRRRGDIKGREGWVQLDLPHPISVARRRMFLRELRTRYEEK